MFTLWLFVVQRASPAVIPLDLLEFRPISLSRPPLTPLQPPCCTDRYIFQLVYTCGHSHKTLGGPEQIDGDNELGQCELVGLFRLLWEKVNPKMKICSPSFLIINRFDFLLQNEFFQSLVLFRTPLTLFVWTERKKMHWNNFRNISFVFHRRPKVVQVWNDNRVSKWLNVHVFAKRTTYEFSLGCKMMWLMMCNWWGHVWLQHWSKTYFEPPLTW